MSCAVPSGFRADLGRLFPVRVSQLGGEILRRCLDDGHGQLGGAACSRSGKGAGPVSELSLLILCGRSPRHLYVANALCRAGGRWPSCRKPVASGVCERPSGNCVLTNFGARPGAGCGIAAATRGGQRPSSSLALKHRTWIVPSWCRRCRISTTLKSCVWRGSLSPI